MLRRLGVLIHSPTWRGEVVAKTPDASRHLSAVVDAAEQVGLGRRVARLEPLIYIQG